MLDKAEIERVQGLEDSGSHEEAIREAERLMKDASTDDERAALLGSMHCAYSWLGRLREARRTLNDLKALRVTDPELALFTDYYEASLLGLEGSFDAAEPKWEDFLERHRDLLATESLGRARSEAQKGLEGAEFYNACQRLVELDKLGQRKEAIREARRMLKRARDDDERHALLGHMLNDFLWLRRFGRARRALRRMRKLRTSNPELRAITDRYEAGLLAHEGKHERAAAAYAGALARNAEVLATESVRYLYEDMLRGRSTALLHMKKYAEALPILQEAVTFRDQPAAEEQEVRLHLGDCLCQTGDMEGAKREFHAVVAYGLRNGTEEWALWNLACLYYRMGALAQTKEQLERILRDFPGPEPAIARKRVYLFLARTFRWLGDRANEAHYTEMAKRS